SSVRVTDIWTFRARVGWVWDNFLPYGFIGAAVARADASRSATVDASLTDTFTDPNTFVQTRTTSEFVGYPATLVDKQGSLFTFGYTAGLGGDYLITPNLFVRGEWEFVGLPNIKNNRVSINTVRTGLGLKF